MRQRSGSGLHSTCLLARRSCCRGSRPHKLSCSKAHTTTTSCWSRGRGEVETIQRVEKAKKRAATKIRRSRTSPSTPPTTIITSTWRTISWTQRQGEGYWSLEGANFGIKISMTTPRGWGVFAWAARCGDRSADALTFEWQWVIVTRRENSKNRKVNEKAAFQRKEDEVQQWAKRVWLVWRWRWVNIILISIILFEMI